MSLVQSGLSAKLTQNALEGLPVTHADLLDIIGVINVNAAQLVKAQKRISALEALMVTPEEIKTSKPTTNDAPFIPLEFVDVVIKFRGYDTVVKVPKDQVEEFIATHNGQRTN